MQKNTQLNLLLSVVVSASLLGAGCEKKTDAPAEARAAPTAESTPAAATTATDTAAAPATTASTPAADTSKSAPDLTPDADGLSKAIVRMETTKGVIEYKFYPKDAPNTVKRIAELVGKGFYNGLTFHRVVPGFVIQGGDPQGTGMGGSGTKINAEFNSRKHVLGAVAMARSQDPNSADSQFYIALGDLPSLDGQYTVYGKVVSGIDVVQKIAVGDKMTKVSFK